MCMYIDPRSKYMLVPLKRKYVYKVVNKYWYAHDKSPHTLKEDEFLSLHRRHLGRIGHVYKSNRKSKSLTKHERLAWSIDVGIHVYSTLDAARKRCDWGRDNIVRCAVDPKHFVARSDCGKFAVYTRVLPVAFVK